MINLIIPPIIIILIVALLITLLAHGVRTIPEPHVHGGSTTKPRRKERRWKMPTALARFFVTARSSVRRTAQRRKVQASAHEAKLRREEVQEQPARQKRNVGSFHKRSSSLDAGQKLSRMGELILSHHRGAAEGTGSAHTAQDPHEALLVKNIEQNPNNPDAYQKLGDYYMEQQNFEDARESYKYVLRLDPRHRRAQEAMKNLDRVLG